MSSPHGASPPAPQRGGGTARAAWILAALSLGLTLIGLFWMRLWLLGIVVGVAAVIVAIVAVSRPPRAWRALIASGAALLLALVPLGIALTALAVRGFSPERPTIDVVLHAEMIGPFTVQRTLPPEPGTNYAEAETAQASDDYEVAYSTPSSNHSKFFIAATGTNREATGARCTVTINGVIVLTKSVPDRMLDCSFDPQALYDELVAPRER